jgi:hypothetical protein
MSKSKKRKIKWDVMLLILISLATLTLIKEYTGYVVFEPGQIIDLNIVFDLNESWNINNGSVKVRLNDQTNTSDLVNFVEGSIINVRLKEFGITAEPGDLYVDLIVDYELVASKKIEIELDEKKKNLTEEPISENLTKQSQEKKITEDITPNPIMAQAEQESSVNQTAKRHPIGIDSDIYNYNSETKVMTDSTGLTFKTETNGVITVNDEKYLAFAIKGTIGGTKYTYTSMDFSWTWHMNQTDNDYVFWAENDNPNFIWRQYYYFYEDPLKPMKIKHYLENNLNDITNARMYYLTNVIDSDEIEFNETRYKVGNIKPLYLQGNFNDKVSNVNFNTIFDFNFRDLIEKNFTINEFYIGSGSIINYPGIDIMAIGFTKNDGFFPKGTSIEIDPTFSTNQIGTIDLAILDENMFAVAWCDETEDDRTFAVYYANGSIITSATDVDDDAGACTDHNSIAVAALNNTAFAVAYFDNTDNAVYYLVYDYKGNTLLSQTLANSVGNSQSASISCFNETTCVIGWFTEAADDVEFKVVDIYGNTLTDVTDVDADAGTQARTVTVEAINSTAFVVGWFKKSSSLNATYIAIYDYKGSALVSSAVLDATADISKSVDVSILNSTAFIGAWHDQGSTRAVFDIYDFQGTLVMNNQAVDSATGTSQSVSVSALNDTAFVYGFWDDADDDHTFRVQDWQNNQLALADVDDSSVYGAQDVASREYAVNIQLCNVSNVEPFVMAYAGGINEATFVTYFANGSVWNGECGEPSAPPIILTTTLVKPINNNNTIDFSSVVFNCSAEVTGGSNLENITLYSDFNGTWQKIETKTLTGTSDSTIFSQVIKKSNQFNDDNFKWNCLVYDNNTNSDWADSNYTFSSWSLGTYLQTKTDNENVTLNYTDVTNSSYYLTGNYTSQIFDASSILRWDNLTWVEHLSEGTSSLNEGPNSVSHAVEDTSIGTVEWKNEANCYLSDDNYATSSPNTQNISYYLKATGFGFSIPSDAVIKGIKAQMELHTDYPSCVKQNSIKIVKDNSVTGNDASTGGFLPGTEAYVNFGGPNSLWGVSWDPSDINSANFGVAISIKNTCDGDVNRIGRVDHIIITVYYTSYTYTNISFQVRSCDDTICSGETFVGPDNTSSTYFYTSPITLNTTLSPNNRYFQYKAFLNTTDNTITPYLQSVNISYSSVAAAVSLINCSSGCFYITNATNGNVSIFDSFGYLDIIGTSSFSQTSLTAPANSFVIENSTGTTVFYIDTSGNLKSTGSLNENQASITASGGNDFRVQNNSNVNIALIDSATGNLYLLKTLQEGVNLGG